MALILCSPLAAQQKETSASDGTFTIQSKVDEVLVPVLVRDKQGNAVGNLRKENFQIFDNDKGQAITGFSIQRRSGVQTEPAKVTLQIPPAATRSRQMCPSASSFSCSTICT